MTTPDLKPCPFCGGRAFVTVEERPDSQSRYLVFFAFCAECGARTKDFPTGNYFWMNYTPDDAAEAWNRRASDDT